MSDPMEDAMAHVVLLEPDQLRALIAHAAGLHAHHAGVWPTVDALCRIGLRLEEQTNFQRMATIARQVACRYGLTLEDLKVQSHRREIAWPRQEAMYLMRLVLREDGKPRYSRPAIARFFGLRDHTTVIHGIQSYKQRLGASRADRPLRPLGDAA